MHFGPSFPLFPGTYGHEIFREYSQENVDTKKLGLKAPFWDASSEIWRIVTFYETISSPFLDFEGLPLPFGRSAYLDSDTTFFDNLCRSYLRKIDARTCVFIELQRLSYQEVGTRPPHIRTALSPDFPYFPGSPWNENFREDVSKDVESKEARFRALSWDASGTLGQFVHFATFLDALISHFKGPAFPFNWLDWFEI